MALPNAATRVPESACAMIGLMVDAPNPLDANPDQRLARRLASGDPGALEEVYRRCGAICFGYLVSKLRDRSAAEDVQQQVFLEVWQRAPDYDSRRAIDQLRRRVPEPAGNLTGVEEDRSAVDEIEELVEQWRLAGLLERLHPDESSVLRMRFYDELTQSEIAERTGIPLGTVKMRMVSGLRRLRELLEER